VYSLYRGPWQSAVRINVSRLTTVLRDTEYSGQTAMTMTAEVQPRAGVKFGWQLELGDALDIAGNRAAEVIDFQPSLDLRLGAHIGAQLRYGQRRLKVDGARRLTADLSQMRIEYHWNVRLFLRLVLQHQDVTRSLALLLPGESEREQTLLAQGLLSYKLTPQTVFFLGYAENADSQNEMQLRGRDRTLFLKLGYGWSP
jgi:hypothetical protein